MRVISEKRGAPIEHRTYLEVRHDFLISYLISFISYLFLSFSFFFSYFGVANPRMRTYFGRFSLVFVVFVEIFLFESRNPRVKCLTLK